MTTNVNKTSLTNRDIRCFNEAKEASSHGELPYNRPHIGCVLALNGKILSKGYNRAKTHTAQAKYAKQFLEPDERLDFKSYLHAEIDCLKKVEHEDIPWGRVKLYVYRACKSREHGLARPCSQCMKKISDLGIKTVYYTTDIGYSKETLYDE